jgi:hypothetical protein
MLRKSDVVWLLQRLHLVKRKPPPPRGPAQVIWGGWTDDEPAS